MSLLVTFNSAQALLRSRFQTFTTPSWDLPRQTYSVVVGITKPLQRSNAAVVVILPRPSEPWIRAAAKPFHPGYLAASMVHNVGFNTLQRPCAATFGPSPDNQMPRLVVRGAGRSRIWRTDAALGKCSDCCRRMQVTLFTRLRCLHPLQMITISLPTNNRAHTQMAAGENQFP